MLIIIADAAISPRLLPRHAYHTMPNVFAAIFLSFYCRFAAAAADAAALIELILADAAILLLRHVDAGTQAAPRRADDT